MVLINISRKLLFCLLVITLFTQCKTEEDIQLPLNESISLFTLDDYYTQNEILESTIDSILLLMTEDERLSQLIISSMGAGTNTYPELSDQVRNNIIGGAVFLGKNEALKNKTTSLQNESRWPLLFSLDAEPSLINSRVTDLTQKFKNTASTIDENEAMQVSMDIASVLASYGIHQNYAPVADLSANVSVINKRSYGNDPADVMNKTNKFIEEHQANGIVATSKHFPGHGNAKGDSHKNLVSINDLNSELKIFESNIDNKVLSVMIGHIAIENGEYGTNGKPSSISQAVITNLLRKKLNFDGIIITDAMNMKGVTQFENCDMKALEAGVDLVLMPKDPNELIKTIKLKVSTSDQLKTQIEESIRRVIRLKLCLGIFKEHHIDKPLI